MKRMLSKESQRVRLILLSLSVSRSGLGHELGSCSTEADVPGLDVARRTAQRKQHAKPAEAQGRLSGRKHTAQIWRVKNYTVNVFLQITPYLNNMNYILL